MKRRLRSRSQKDRGMLCGGWSKTENNQLSDELSEIFTSAVKDSEYADLEALSLEGTQVVAGINYRFLCRKNGDDGLYSVKVYRDLKGSCSVLSVEKN